MDLTKGSARINIDATELAKLRSFGALVEDPRRQRPRYFDGRFLAARDLTRDQQYFLNREADLGQAAGSGVANGLAVSVGADGNTVDIAAGDGITPAGELVLLEQDITLRLSDVPQAEQLSARFGLGRIPVTPLRSRNGLFVLCLRPVEFTANPIGAYPTSITGTRTVEDGDVIEATAIVLVPWPDDGGNASLDVRRSLAARAIFVDREARSLSANLLPLAMLGLQNNSVAWIDLPMVRRELGADRADLPGLGLAPRALRLAHLLQHQDQLADLAVTLGNKRFAAASQFAVLPPAGPLPANVIATNDFTQGYFPTQIDVDFTAIPEDELPALVEEALALPPIDLTAPAEQLDSVAVMILAPVPRADWTTVSAKLSTRLRTIRASAPNLVAQRQPLEILQRLRLPVSASPVADPGDPSDAQWTQLAQGPLWYVRRRSLAYRDDLVGASQPLNAPMLRAAPTDLQRAPIAAPIATPIASPTRIDTSAPVAAPVVAPAAPVGRSASTPTLTKTVTRSDAPANKRVKKTLATPNV